MIYPVLFSCAIGIGFGLDTGEIQAGISEFTPSKMRMNVKQLRNDIIVLDDAYNANPQSMMAGLNILAERDAKKRIAVLGDMLELGKYSEELHRKIGEKCSELNIDVVLTYGKDAEIIAKYAGGRHCRSKMDLAGELIDEVKPGSAILVKASRGMHFEEIIQFLEERYK